MAFIRHNLHHSDKTDKTNDKMLSDKALLRWKKCTIEKDRPDLMARNFTSTQNFQRGCAFDTKGNSIRLSDNQVMYVWKTGSSETLEYDNLKEAADIFKEITGCKPIIISSKEFIYTDYGNPWDWNILDKRLEKDPNYIKELIRRGAIVVSYI